MALGAELEEFGTKEAMADDQKVADVYAKKGAKVADLDEATVEQVARASRVRPPGRTTPPRPPLSAELLKLAEDVHVS